MPELAEVEFYRKQWDCGLAQKIHSVKLHAGKRLFRGTDTNALAKLLPGSTLLGSEASGKQMLFRFSKGLWLGLHLGMTGKLVVAAPGHTPAPHDHFVLGQVKRVLVFNDPRQFGRVQFHHGPAAPDWWTRLPAPLTGPAFTAAVMADFLQRHRRLPIKAALLLQIGFPGIGNWMADEILWRTRLDPRTPAGRIADFKTLWQTVRFVCRAAMNKVGHDFSDPPRGWFYHERWTSGGRCPKDGAALHRATIGGRTTAWCPKCQPPK